MSTRIERPCKVFNCPNTTAYSNGYCEEHQYMSRDKRGSASKRGYNRRWQKWRLRFLKHHPLCEDCLEENKTTPATEVHHKQKLREHPELQYVESNCMPLCSKHHKIRTARGE